MKYSIYNSIIHVDKDNLLLYNANSDKFLIITQKSKEDIDKGVDFLKAENTKLFQKLQEPLLAIAQTKLQSSRIRFRRFLRMILVLNFI